VNLAELLVVVALSLALLAGTYSLSHAPGAVASSSLGLPRLIDEARALAAASGDGATVILSPKKLSSGGAGDFDVALYRNRPHPSASPPLGATSAGIVLERTEHLAGSLTSSLAASQQFAIFISTAGTVSYAAWTPAAGPLAQEPPCSAPLTLRLAAGPTNAAFQLPCDSASLIRIYE